MLIFLPIAHPNIRLFIYQGGLQSTEETLNYGVPVVGCPFIWDQKFNVKNMEKFGVGVVLDRNNLTTENIKAAIYKVITNKRYCVITA